MSQNPRLSILEAGSNSSSQLRKLALKIQFCLPLIATTFWMSTFAPGQAVNQDGFKPYGSYQGSGIDNVNLSNGHLELKIPIIGYPQRGGKLGLNFAVRYDASHWYESMDCSQGPPVGCIFQWKGAPGGARLAWDEISDVNFTLAPTSGPSGGPSLTLPDRSTHPMGRVTNTNSYESLDGSGLRVDGNTVIYYPDGTHIFPATSTSPAMKEDTNGNQIVADRGTWTITDSLARHIPDPVGLLPLTPPDTQNCSGSLPISGTAVWRVPGANGSVNIFKLCWATVTLFIHHFDSDDQHHIEPHTAEAVLQSIVLPDNTAWTFEYTQPDANGVNWADLSKITLPAGGSISYTWDHPYGCGAAYAVHYGNNKLTSSRVLTRTIDANDGLGPNTWHYGEITDPGTRTLTTTVTDPLQNDTVHTFVDLNSSCSLFESTTAFYSGPSTGGTLQKTITTDYSWTPNPLVQSPPAQQPPAPAPPMNVVPIRTTIAWPNGMTTKIEHDYDSGFTFNVPNAFSSPPGQLGPPATGSYGKITAERDFNYGSGALGLLKSTSTTYFWQSNASYLTYNVLNTPAAFTTYDPAVNMVAQTLKFYDETTPASSGVTVGHSLGPVNGNVRGNVTTIKNWLNGSTVSTPNCPVVVSNGLFPATATYFDTGLVQQSVDTCQHKTTYLYSPISPLWGAFVTQLCNSLNQCANMGYDSNTGALTSSTDLNNQNTTFVYEDIGRLKSISYPDGGQTTANYPDPTTVEKKQLQDATANTWIDQFRYFDGLGRTNKTKLVDPEGDDFVDMTPDELGRVKKVSNAHRTVSSLTDGTTQYIYDALGRTTQATEQDGSVSSTAYNVTTSIAVPGVCNQTTDEAGKQRGTCTDSLGRVIEVDEPTSGPLTVNYHATMQTDGNFVLSNSASTSLWSTGTGGTNAQSIMMQDDGNLVLYLFKWSAGTYAAPTPGSYPAQSCSIGTYLVINQRINANQCIVSPHGQYMLYMAPNGNFYIYDNAHGTAPWGAGTYGHPGAYAIMQGDGNLCVDDANNLYVWCSGTNGTFAERLDMEDDGRIIIYKSAWNSGTSDGQFNWAAIAHPSCDVGTGTGWTGILSSGQCFISPNGRFELLVQSDGNMVIYDRSVTPNAALWSTKTTVSPIDPALAMRTLYAYDALGNLIRVDQKGTAPTDSMQWRTRTFTYDSLSRLVTASNPESGTISYSYDADGNLLQKTSPAPNQTGSLTQTVSYCYDVLHRVTGKGYGVQSCPLSTPVVTYAYDSGTYAKGHLTSLTDQAGTANYTYDNMGRIATETRLIAGVSKSASYTYYLDGSVKTLTYPSGRAITYKPNSAGNLISALDANGAQYVSNATHYPTGAEFQRFMPGIYFRTDLNQRLQVSRFYSDNGQINSFFIDKTYNYGPLHQDNGDVMSITNNKDSNRTQTFSYDALNRISSGWSTANTGAYSWGENYSIDAWGNLQISPMSGKAHGGNFTLSGNAQNRPTGLAYDAAGNLMAYLSATYTYDQENRLSSTAGMSYTYDGNGERMLKSNSSTGAAIKRYWSMGGNTLAEGDGSGNLTAEYVYFGGQRVARIDLPANTVHYYLSDHLGSTSVVASAAGAVEEESDYYPFGTEMVVSNSGSNRYKFNGKERDNETQLDYFGARYYGNILGRFLTPDWASHATAVPYANFGNPQSLNLYTYAGNNPTTMGDPDGHCPIPGLCAALEVLTGIARDGGVKPYATNLAIGTGKGLGALGVQAGRMIAAPNIYAGIASQAMPLPKAVTPSNMTQAQASFATQIVVPTVLGTAAGPVIGALEGGSSGAQAALDAAIVARTGNPGAMIGAYDATTGATTVGASGDISRLGTINPQVIASADQVGGIGAVNPGVTAPVGCCAEVDAANQLANAGSNLSDVRFTEAIRPRTGEVVPKCANCQSMFPNHD
jgi:RHS repeat-associated protein